SAEPGALLETVRSRCQAVRFAPLPAEAIEERLAAEVVDAPGAERRAAARLCGGDPGRAGFVLSEQGRELRRRTDRTAAAARGGGRGPEVGARGRAACPGRRVGPPPGASSRRARQ